MVWISMEPDPFAAMEHYGDAVAACSRQPARTGANSLWCSWYPIRMGISEEVVLANAEIAARHFKPLGFDLIQLDHGWQRGDVCGDWIPNQRFPHGLKWLSEQLHDSLRDATGPMDRPDDRCEDQPIVPEIILTGCCMIPRASRPPPVAGTGRPIRRPTCSMLRTPQRINGSKRRSLDSRRKASATTRSTSSPLRAAAIGSTIRKCPRGWGFAPRNGGHPGRRRPGRVDPLLPDTAAALRGPGRQFLHRD